MAIDDGPRGFFDDRTAALKRKPLSAREMDVLRLIVEGLTDLEIATRLGIARPTVTNHVQHILRKFGVNSRVAATALAIRLGIV